MLIISSNTLIYTISSADSLSKIISKLMDRYPYKHMLQQKSKICKIIKKRSTNIAFALFVLHFYRWVWL